MNVSYYSLQCVLTPKSRKPNHNNHEPRFSTRWLLYVLSNKIASNLYACLNFVLYETPLSIIFYFVTVKKSLLGCSI